MESTIEASEALNDKPALEEITEWGAPSEKNTEEAVRALAQEIIDIPGPLVNQSKIIDADTLHELADIVLREIPFFYQGSGVATIPKQIEHFRGLRSNLATPMSEQTRKTLMKGLDCKLPTVVLAYTLQTIADHSNQTVSIYLLTRGRSVHPSLMVEINSENQTKQVYKIDFWGRYDKSPIKTQPGEILLPIKFREHTESYVAISNLKEEEYTAKYRNGPYTIHDLNWQTLKLLDLYFIES